MRVLVTICARGGSKGIPGKNIKLLNGRPLITYTIDLAKKLQNENGEFIIALSTDSEEIVEVAAINGLETTYRRPPKLATDSAGKVEVLADLLAFEENRTGVIFDYLLDLDVTSPLRNLQDIQSAFNLFLDDDQALTLFSVNPAARNPYFNMVEQKESGYYAQVKKLDSSVSTRQSAPLVYDLNASFYIYRRSFFDLSLRSVITERSLIFQVPHICFDLDHPIDFEFLSFLMEHDKLGFEL